MSELRMIYLIFFSTIILLFTNVLFWIQVQKFCLKKMQLNMSSANCGPFSSDRNMLTHWGRVTHICVSKLTIIGTDNGLPPGRRQAIIWTNAGILLIGPLGTNLSEILIKIYTFSFKEMHLKMSSGNWQPSCFGLNVLTNWDRDASVYSAIIGSDIGLWPVQQPAIIWTIAGLLLTHWGRDKMAADSQTTLSNAFS